MVEQTVEIFVSLYENHLAGGGGRSRAILVAGVNEVHPRIGFVGFHLRGEFAEPSQHSVLVGFDEPFRD